MKKAGTPVKRGRGRPRGSTNKSRSRPSSNKPSDSVKKASAKEKPVEPEKKKRAKKAMDPVNRKVGQSISMPMWLWAKCAQNASDAGMNLSGYIENMVKEQLEVTGEKLPQPSKIKQLEATLADVKHQLQGMKN